MDTQPPSDRDTDSDTIIRHPWWIMRQGALHPYLSELFVAVAEAISQRLLLPDWEETIFLQPPGQSDYLRITVTSSEVTETLGKLVASNEGRVRIAELCSDQLRTAFIDALVFVTANAKAGIIEVPEPRLAFYEQPYEDPSA